MFSNVSSAATDEAMVNAFSGQPPQIEIRFIREADDRLTMIDTQGQSFHDVTALRLFPLTAPDEWISVFDREGNELVCIANLDQLRPDDSEVLSEELKRREFVPEILRVKSVSSNTIPCEWEVDTDRGPTRFILKDEKDVRRLGPKQILILDAHGIRYLVRHLQSLDSTSRRAIERYI